MKRLLLSVFFVFLFSFSIMTVNASDTYVTISFEDFGIRESVDCDFPDKLGVIIDKTKVKITLDDTIASVTLRLLEKKGIDVYYNGTTQFGGGFYLESIDNFTSYNGIKVSDGYGLGEFSAGKDSGWMISLNGYFIDKSASEYTVKNGDYIRWQYTASGLGDDLKDETVSETTASPKIDKTENTEKTTAINKAEDITVVKNTETEEQTKVSKQIMQTKETNEDISENNTEKTETSVAQSKTEITTTDYSVKENTTVEITNNNSMKENKTISQKNNNIVLYIIFIIAGVVAVAIIICIIILYKDKKNKEAK